MINTKSLQQYESNMHITDEPEIEVDKAWVHGGLGYEAVLSCLVTIINHDRYKEDHFKTTGLWWPPAKSEVV